MAEIPSPPELTGNRTPSPKPPLSYSGWVEDDPLYGHTQTGDTPREGPEFPWSAEKFGMKHDDLFHKLAHFNTCQVQLRSTAAFVKDVRFACERASTTQELYDILAERKDLAQQRLDKDLDESMDRFSERRLPGLSGPQFTTIARLLQSRTLESVLDVVRACQLAGSGSGEDMWSAALGDISWGVDAHRPSTQSPVETLPATPSPDPISPLPAEIPSPILTAEESLPDTLPPHSDARDGSPDSRLEQPLPPQAPPTEPPGDEAGGHSTDQRATSPTPASPVPTGESPSQASSKSTATSDALPATPPDLEHPKAPYHPCEGYEPIARDGYTKSPRPLSRKRSQEDDDIDKPIASAQGLKRRKTNADIL